MEYCSNGACPNGGKCFRTTSGSQFCSCDTVQDCNAGQICQNYNCLAPATTCPSSCTKDADCVSCPGGATACLNKQCQKPPSCPSSCSKDADCASCSEGRTSCRGGQCLQPTPPTCPSSCTQDADCKQCPNNRTVCWDGRCQAQGKKSFGEPCRSSEECQSGICAGDSGKATCTVACDPQQPGSCPAAYRCIRIHDRAACLPRPSKETTSSDEPASLDGPPTESVPADGSASFDGPFTPGEVDPRGALEESSLHPSGCGCQPLPGGGESSTGLFLFFLLLTLGLWAAPPFWRACRSRRTSAPHPFR